MKAPIFWLKEFVEINTPIKDLMWRLTEVGVTTEAFEKVEGETVLEVEVTPNRPDWLSIIGIAREIAAIENSSVKEPKPPEISKPQSSLPFSIKVDNNLAPRYTGVLMEGVKVAPSPQWLIHKIRAVGLRPINNLVDITNLIMYELGIPIHVFDYDKFPEKKLVMQQALGGEKFVSVDEIEYILPRGAIIIKDQGTVIDLCGIKGGGNCGIDKNTQNIYIHVPVYKPALIRKTCQTLKLTSDASYIYERGANAGGTLDTLKRVVDLILDLAGGKIASKIFDYSDQKYAPRTLDLKWDNLEKILGITIEKSKVKKILENLGIKTQIQKTFIRCTIPTHRGDIQIQEDLAEEVARIYGYNNFPQTLPTTKPNPAKVPYYYNENIQLKVKNYLVGSGYFETKTLSLISEKTFEDSQLDKTNIIKLENPVSSEFQILNPSLIPSLLDGVKQNENEKEVKLFELSKIYLGPLENNKEPYSLGAILYNSKYSHLKGVLDGLFEKMGITKYEIINTTVSNGLWHPGKSGEIIINKKSVGTIGYLHPRVVNNFGLKTDVFAFELDVNLLSDNFKNPVYEEPPKFPAQIEDVTFSFPEKTRIGEVVSFIKLFHKNISEAQLVDSYKNYFTFRIWYQNPIKTLDNNEVKEIRNKLTLALKKNFGGQEKE